MIAGRGPIFALIKYKFANMPQNKPPRSTKILSRPIPETNWFERQDAERGTPFKQTSPDKEGTKGIMSPYRLFSLFTYEIILEKKVFVR